MKNRQYTCINVYDCLGFKYYIEFLKFKELRQGRQQSADWSMLSIVFNTGLTDGN